MDLQISIGMRTDRRLTAGMGGPSRPTPFFCEPVSSHVPSPPPGRRAPSKSGVVAGSWSRVPAHRPRPPPPPPLGAPPQTSSEKNPKAMPFRRDRPPAHFPRHSPSIRRDFSPTKAPLSDNARNRKAGRACGSRFSGLIKPMWRVRTPNCVEVRVGVVLIIGPACFHVKKPPSTGLRSQEPGRASGGEQSVVNLPPSPQPRPCLPFCHVDRPCP